jgi:outer membrane lipoprotein
MQREFLDPATLPRGTFVTVTGDVTGSITMPLDETDYTYPVIEIKNLRVWSLEEAAYRGRPYPYYSPAPYWGPYWGPYWRPWPYYW